MISYIIIGILIIICLFLSRLKFKELNELHCEENNIKKEIIELEERKNNCYKTLEDLDKEIDVHYKELKELDNNCNLVAQEQDKIKLRVDNLLDQEKAVYDRINNAGKLQEEVLKRQTTLAQEAFAKYCETLESNYQEKDKEYLLLREMLEKAYDERHKKLREASIKEEEELENIRSTRASAIEALRREKEILASSSFYCLQITDEDKADIVRLENVKKTLNKPRVLSMLIWSTYYQKELKSLSANILGTGIKTGIYKITNIITGEVYIGQAVDIAKRWTDHAKHGLGIDTPAGNKLYKAMQEYGLYSFSWELLEECESKLLNEKERFYIDLYQSVDYGYNILKGVN